MCDTPMNAGRDTAFRGYSADAGLMVDDRVYRAIYPVLLGRFLDEERILRRDLPGYIEYTQKVRHRHIPRVW